MNNTPQLQDDRLSPPRDPVIAVVETSLKVGAACGGAGFLFGASAGVVKGTAPFLFGLASGVQTFGLGLTFWGLRSTFIEVWTPKYHTPTHLTPKHPTPSDLIKISSLSGGLTGGLIAIAARGRSNVIPGAVMFSLFGCLGQIAANKYYAPREVDVAPKKGFWRRMSERSFSPVTVLTDEQYAEMLREKMLKLDVEISIIEDKIAALEVQQSSTIEQASSSTSSGE